MSLKEFSCVDCGRLNCDKGGSGFPQFCPGKDMDKDRTLAIYEEEENKKVALAAAEVEVEGYCRETRVEEIIRFAKKIGAQKLGIATCVGLMQESKTLTEILRAHGFQVYGICCKTGAIPKAEIGLEQSCSELGKNICNPIMQAQMLNKEGTELNLVMGLCVGHDSLFYKYAEAPTTTVVTKDRVLGHNPVAALYTANSYYNKKLMP